MGALVGYLSDTEETRMSIVASGRPTSSLSQWWTKHGVSASDYTVPAQRGANTILAATAGGAAVGALVGIGGGAVSTYLNEKSESLATQDIVDPKFEGYNYWRVEDTSRTCVGTGDNEVCWEDTDGWYHRYSPRYDERIVGDFEKPAFHNSHKWNPINGALWGALGGGLIGLGLSVGAAVLGKAVIEDKPEPRISARKLREIEDKTGKHLLIGGAVGAGTGALLGGLGGAIEVRKGPTVARTYIGPVTEHRQMGLIPPDSYQHTTIRQDRSGAAATQPVYRDVPLYDQNGQPRLEAKTENFETARFGAVKGTLVGGLVGLGAGVAGGLAFNALEKIVSSEGGR